MLEHTITITVRSDAACAEIAGTVTREDGATRPFAGWIGLIAAVDALLAPAEPAAALPDQAATNGA